LDTLFEAIIDWRQIPTAEVPGGPGRPSLLTQDRLGTSHRPANVVGQEVIAAQPAAVVGEPSTRRLAPIEVVDLEDSIVVGSIGVGWTDHFSSIGTLVLRNAGPLAQLVTRNSEIGHLPSQGTPIHGAG